METLGTFQVAGGRRCETGVVGSQEEHREHRGQQDHKIKQEITNHVSITYIFKHSLLRG